MILAQLLMNNYLKHLYGAFLYSKTKLPQSNNLTYPLLIIF